MEEEIVPLLICNDGSFELCNQTLEWLSTLEKPFGIISCAGKFRTGKSFLLNRILSTKPSQGFGVGETVQACTKGLWISKKLIKVHDDLDVIIMDTEGIDALDASSLHDTKIFTLGLLLSSVFLYNSVGHIDETAVQTLSFMSKVSEFIDSDARPPKFYWILRDFSLQMVDKNGKSMDNKEYLEYSLRESSDEKNDTRSFIKKLFVNRNLYTLPRPSKIDSAQNLDKTHKNLNPKFMSEMARLREILLDEVQPVTADGIPMSGNMFVKMCNILVNKIKLSEMPVMKDTWSMLKDTQHNDVYKKLYSRLTTELNKWEKNTFKNLEMMSINTEKDFTSFFIKDAMKPHDSKIFKEFKEAIKIALDQKVAEKQINIKEIVQSSTSKLDLRDHLSVLEEFNTFLNENGEKNTCLEWFPNFLETLYSFMNNLEKEASEKYQKETRETFQYDLEEITRKYEDVMSTLEHEKEEVLRLKSEMVSQDYKYETCVQTFDACMNTDFEENEAVETDAEEVTVEEYTTLLKEKESLCKENELLAESLESCKEQLTFLKQKVKEEIVEIKSEYDSKVEKMTVEISNKITENEGSTKKIQILEEKLKCQKDEIKKLEGKNTEIQTKFMEFHKQTVDEIRKRDNEIRQDQTTMNQELINLTKKVHEEKRVTSVAQTETLYLKRQLEDNESIQKDMKRIKRDYNDTVISKNRSEVENSNLKSRLDEVVKECDSLKKIKMQLESKVSVLETTTMLSNCKSNILK